MSKSNLRLDRSRDFGEVHPPEDGAHYHQDGLYFGVDGNVLVDHDLNGEDGNKKIQDAQKRSKAKEAADAAYAKAMADDDIEKINELEKANGGLTDQRPRGARRASNNDTEQQRSSSSEQPGTHTSDQGTMTAGTGGAGDGMTASEKKQAAAKGIIGHLTGETPVPFFQLRKLYEDGLGVKIQDMKNAREVAIEKGLITADRIKG